MAWSKTANDATTYLQGEKNINLGQSGWTIGYSVRGATEGDHHCNLAASNTGGGAAMRSLYANGGNWRIEFAGGNYIQSNIGNLITSPNWRTFVATKPAGGTPSDIKMFYRNREIAATNGGSDVLDAANGTFYIGVGTISGPVVSGPIANYANFFVYDRELPPNLAKELSIQRDPREIAPEALLHYYPLLNPGDKTDYGRGASNLTESGTARTWLTEPQGRLTPWLRLSGEQPVAHDRDALTAFAYHKKWVNPTVPIYDYGGG